MPVFFYNTMSRCREEFVPIEGSKVGIYTCGPTVYNFATIGNFRAYIFEDLLRRTLKYFGYNIVQVMNLTDVDDKTIRDSRAAGMGLMAYTEKYKKAFFEDIAALRIEKAEFYPEATAHIPEMIEIIKTLLEKGYAYQADDGSVYFSVAKFADYGKLSKIDMENQMPGARVKNDEYAKDSVADFALWKAWNEADGDVFWESPWGKGRPGWHIECSAMSMKYLGKTFDIHTGGIDNMFPHHEDEIAQSEAANGCRFVNYWLHCEHLIVDGQKMSKSLGNFFTLRDLFEKGFTNREIRWALLGTHYRKKLNFGLGFLENARTALQKFDAFFIRLGNLVSADVPGDDADQLVASVSEAFRNGLADDLNVSEAIAAIYHLESEAGRLFETGKLSSKGATAVFDAFRDFNRVFDVFHVELAAQSVPPEVLKLAEERQRARKSKDFKKADEIRDALNNMGWQIEDTAKGPRPIRIG